MRSANASLQTSVNEWNTLIGRLDAVTGQAEALDPATTGTLARSHLFLFFLFFCHYSFCYCYCFCLVYWLFMLHYIIYFFINNSLQLQAISYIFIVELVFLKSCATVRYADFL